MKNLGLYVFAIAIIFIEIIVFTFFLVSIQIQGTFFNLIFGAIAIFTWNAIVNIGSSATFQN